MSQRMKPTWRPGRLERKVGEKARWAAEREAASIPWPQLQKAREKFVAWEAFGFWVRAIENAEGNVPQWLVRTVEERCPGFLKFVAKRRRRREDRLPLLWSH